MSNIWNTTELISTEHRPIISDAIRYRLTSQNLPAHLAPCVWAEQDRWGGWYLKIRRGSEGQTIKVYRLYVDFEVGSISILLDGESRPRPDDESLIWDICQALGEPLED
jgi:hypothetical protein